MSVGFAFECEKLGDKEIQNNISNVFGSRKTSITRPASDYRD